MYGFHGSICECLWGREASNGKHLCLSENRTRPAYGLSALSVSLFPTSTSHCSPGSLRRIVVSAALARVFVSRVAPCSVWSQIVRVVTSSYEGSQVNRMAFETWNREGGGKRVSSLAFGSDVFGHIRMLKPLLFLLTQHKLGV